MVPEGEQCYAEGQGSKRDHCVAFRPRLLSRREAKTTEDEDVRQAGLRPGTSHTASVSGSQLFSQPRVTARVANPRGGTVSQNQRLRLSGSQSRAGA